MRRMIWQRVLLGSLFSIFICADVGAQQSTAQISGTVTDISGAVLPGGEVSARQTGTGFVRRVVTNETGSYTMPNLPIGPYRLEASLPGFRTLVRSGIVLTVNANSVINIVLEVGQLTETVEVQADAALVETRSTSISNFIDNVRVMELPLNARKVTELIILSGAAVGGGIQNTDRQYPSDIISVGGGLKNGINFWLDGGVHNEPYGNQALPLPFPDAMQEFKVETSAPPAQYGFHAAGTVNVVTKSGTNAFHGSLFEFVRNRMFNARNTFANEKDPLKRNQFGGVIGGPIKRDKLFFFAGVQRTIQRTDALGVQAYIPTPQMLAGDWTTFASSACQARGAITLRAPFVNNRINPALFSPIAVEAVKRLNAETIDACGLVRFGRRVNQDEWFPIGRMDWQVSGKQQMFGRFETGRLWTSSDYDGKTVLSINEPEYFRHSTSFVLGHTYSFSANVVSSFRGTILRTVNDKDQDDYFHWGELGVKNYYYPENYAKLPQLSVTGSFSLIGGRPTPAITNNTVYQFAEDISWLRGNHQIGFGVNQIHNIMNYTAGTTAPGSFNFNGSFTGASLGDFMAGRVNTFTQDIVTSTYPRQNFIGTYLQDTWKVNRNWTLNLGLRWEPYFAPYDQTGKELFFSRERFDQGARSQVFPNTPAGIYTQGEGGIPDNQKMHANEWKHFAPRVGFAWDPAGNGLTVIRGAYGIFFDAPHLHQYGGRRNNPGRGGRVQVRSVSFDDPWAGFPGGNPFPLSVGTSAEFPVRAVLTLFPWNLPKPYINQWNLSFQRQFGANWLLAGNYLGNNTIHMFYRHEANPAVYVPGVGDANGNCFSNGVRVPFTVSRGAACSTTGNTAVRRVLYLANPSQGQFYSNLVMGHGDATSSYNALWLQIQRRRVAGFTLQANYTWSHCIYDGYQDVIQNNGGYVPERRGASRGNCELDRRHNFNMSTVYELPRFSNRALQALAGGWQISSIVRLLSGQYVSLSSGDDYARTNTEDQRPDQILASPYAANKSASQWLNPAAFSAPAVGTYGNMGAQNILGPGSFRVDLGVTRKFAIRENQTLEFRAEVFNLPNRVNLGNPVTSLASPNFGRILSADDPRIMQLALKYVF